MGARFVDRYEVDDEEGLHESNRRSDHDQFNELYLNVLKLERMEIVPKPYRTPT